MSCFDALLHAASRDETAEASECQAKVSCLMVILASSWPFSSHVVAGRLLPKQPAPAFSCEIHLPTSFPALQSIPQAFPGGLPGAVALLEDLEQPSQGSRPCQKMGKYLRALSLLLNALQSTCLHFSPPTSQESPTATDGLEDSLRGVEDQRHIHIDGMPLPWSHRPSMSPHWAPQAPLWWRCRARWRSIDPALAP